MFDLAYSEDVYLLTHSGLHKAWYDTYVYNNQDNYDKVADILNNWLHSDAYDKKDFLGMYSHYRGWGGFKNSSVIWGDVREWYGEWYNKKQLEENKELGYYQIFGHTQLEDQPIIEKDFACIDNRRPYRLSGNTLTDLETNKTYTLK